MKTGMASRLGWAAKITLAVLLVAMGFGASPKAQADQLLKASTTLVYGSSADTFSFSTPGAGTVTAEVSSLPWPVPLSALSFVATTSSETLSSWSTTSPMASPQIETFDVAGAGTYFAHVMATAGGTLDMGLYSVMLTFSSSAAVPLPAAIELFLLGVFVLLALRGTLLAPGVSRKAPGNESVMYSA
jgi:hypothetical protein